MAEVEAGRGVVSASPGAVLMHHTHRCGYGASMNEQPDPVIRKTVSLRARVWQEIEDYQFANRVKRDSEAIRRLIELGLKAAKAAK